SSPHLIAPPSAIGRQSSMIISCRERNARLRLCCTFSQPCIPFLIGALLTYHAQPLTDASRLEYACVCAAHAAGWGKAATWASRLLSFDLVGRRTRRDVAVPGVGCRMLLGVRGGADGPLRQSSGPLPDLAGVGRGVRGERRRPGHGSRRGGRPGQ